VILYFSRQYERAIEQFRSVLAMDPNFPRAHAVVLAYVEKGMFAEALADAERWRHQDGTPVWELIAYVYARSGQQVQARRELEQWEKWSQRRHPTQTEIIPSVYAAVGRTDEAIAFLQKAYSEHSNVVVLIKVAPYFDPLRGDPRFQELLRRVGLAQQAASASRINR